MSKSYDDIIHLPHHVSTTRPQMPIRNRAAQFIPFQALAGYEAAIEETARLTEKRIVLGEEAIAALDMKLSILMEMIECYPQAAVTYFQPDEKKEGGAYCTVTGAVKKIDEVQRTICFTDGFTLAFDDIIEIESDLFRDLP